MDPTDLKKRTKNLALRIIKLVQFLKQDAVGRVIGNQILRSGTSVAANYRAACRAKSAKDFISKLSIVIEESDETGFWLELLVESSILKLKLVQDLIKEVDEITSIMVASKNSAIRNQRSN